MYSGANQANTYAQTAAGQEPREQTAAEAIQASLNDIGQRLNALKSRLSDLGARALGSEPTPKPEGKPPQPVPNGSFDGIGMSLRDVGTLVDDCHSLARRLERIA